MMANMELDLMKTAVLTLLLLCAPTCWAQHEWQKPKPLVPLAQIKKIIGPVETFKPSKPLHILWVWGYDKNHRPGAHDYLKVRDFFTGLLKKVEGVTVEQVYEFPSKEQFDKGTIAVFFLHLPQLSDDQYNHFQTFIRGGGGVVALHETAIMRPTSEGKKLAQCLGMAWDEGRSQWGAIFEDVTLETEHKIFKGFPPKLRIMDEFYWNLHQIDGAKCWEACEPGRPRVVVGRCLHRSCLRWRRRCSGL